MKIARNVVLGAVLIAVAGWVVWHRAGDGIQVFAAGTAAPDFQLQDQDGNLVQLSALRGQRVLLDFYRGHY